MDTTPVNRSPSGGAVQGAKRSIAMAALAIGLLVVGGSAVAFAADPSPSATPGATTAPTTGDDGTTAPQITPGTDPSGQARPGHGAHGDCEADGSNGTSSGGTSSDSGTTPDPSAVPVPSLDVSDV